jgi:hypothetical protein
VRRERALALAILTMLAPLLTACAATTAPSVAVAPAAAVAPMTLQRAYASLTHTPRGTVTLTWRPSDRSLIIDLEVVGFAPNSSHPTQIRGGQCASSGPLLYDLGALVADGQGRIATRVTLQQVDGGAPSPDWYLDMQNAVGDDSYSLIELACATIDTVELDTTRAQVVHVSVLSGVGPSMNVSGQATLEIESGKLVVVVTLSGLEPFSTHPLFIQQGDCAHLGASVFSLYPVQADSGGRAKNKQTFQGVMSIPGEGWSLVILRGVHMQSQIDAAPISCGSITPASLI